MKRVIIFGIFDGVHDGHRDLFRQARELGDELVVIVGRDEIAEKLKGKKPKYAEDERIRLVQREPLVDNAILGDRELSAYTMLEQCNPDVVCLGYDQDELEEDLRRWLALRLAQGKQDKSIQIYRAKPYRESTFHSSLIQGS
ncbi:MAG: adenylyltransferase/cytidyltransferase family protein [Candidatus Wildermuthbacteria bacterium]|nr:adenylyltransferase/cytidyltransferase family protein [Candidatus Wildermuthbacteria bacterium]